jgi:hypothetical protein
MIDFKPIPSHPGYFAGDDGSILGKSGRLLTPWVDPKGYAFVAIQGEAGKGLRRSVHRLVCEAFHGVAPAGKEVAHSDGNPGNNVPANLSWKTRAENHADKRAHGTHRQGERIPWAKLTAEKVHEIRPLLAEMTDSAISRRYGVTPAAITHIRSGRNWKHVR